MRNDFYLLINFEIKTPDLAVLMALVAEVVAATRTEAGCLGYEFALSPDGTSAWMIEHFADSAAFIEHATVNFARHAEAWNQLLGLKSLSVIGNADAGARALLPPDAIYLSHVDGFSK